MTKEIAVRGTDAARIVTLIRTTALKGKGIQEDPYREVYQYWTLTGRFLFEEQVSGIEKSNHWQLEQIVQYQYTKPLP